MDKPDRLKRGIYLLPNLFTTAGLFAGFYAIVAAINNRFEYAAVAIFVAIITDGLDGRVARMTHTQSDFGAQYDSLVDMVAFGLAPALVVYLWILSDIGRDGWLAAFIFTAAAGLRLARFNTQICTVNKRYFQGLASPAAAAMVAGMVWVGTDMHWLENHMTSTRIGAFILTIVAGALMVSTIRYRSFKDLDLKGRVPFVAVLAVVMVFVFISYDPPLVLFSLFLLYGASGPWRCVVRLNRRRLLLQQRRKKRTGQTKKDPTAPKTG